MIKYQDQVSILLNILKFILKNIARSRSLPEAHLKSLRLFRKWCRYMPFVVNWTGYKKYANPE